MRIGILSDCHLEGDDSLNKVYAMLPAKGAVDVFLVVGDATRGPWAYDLCLMIHEQLGCPVLYTPGNHEYYYTHDLRITMEEMEQQCREDFSRHSDIHYLQNDSIDIDGVSFFGSTWWSNFRGYGSEYMAEAMAISDLIADFRYINASPMTETQVTNLVNQLNRKSAVMRGQAAYENAGVSFFNKITAQDMIDLNTQAVGAYKRWHESTPGKKVLMSHFPMLKELQHSAFKPNPYFVSTDDLLIERLAPDLLVFAHTHCNYRKTVRGVDCISNQFGYGHESTGFDPNLVVTI
jgi:predicted phosphodiesterase